MSVAFNSDESRATKYVAFIEKNFGHLKKGEYYGTGEVEDCKLSPRLSGNPKEYHTHISTLHVTLSSKRG
jgi:hypothetical protein